MAARISALLLNEIQRLEVVRVYIQANLQKELTLQQIARRFGYSDSTLKRHFTIHFGESIHHFIFKTRMECAKKMLIEHTVSISEIAILAGYSSFSGFTHAFSKYFGYRPSDFKRRQ